LRSGHYSLKHEVPAILESGGGAIVNNASGAGITGHAAMHAYSAAKHGVVGLTRSAALQFARQGVRVNVLETGLIETPSYAISSDADPVFYERLIAKIPAGRLGKESEVAALVAFLLSDEASLITGAVLPSTVDSPRGSWLDVGGVTATGPGRAG
jgi:NAD(P)-dependent dehydrogenase (short-subunit alcohol dehydrogenase family)